ncbi:hypothetical protein FA15DRAFT_668572 [Coprinopsis marcescibilis]|uniref:Uncharacterized protein n=1 Tax=Coprinopsis marcescibilis TaxID=230819 RepID=A0A5C3KY20_COPMA|nr:hypothetical protein FA15DRAFT_668572 [Coprinopsis marcescibilis]
MQTPGPAFSTPFSTPGPSNTLSFTPGSGFPNPFNSHNSGVGLTWGLGQPPSTVEKPAAADVTFGGSASCKGSNGAGMPGRAKKTRYRSYRPANSSPLTRLPNDYADHDDDEMDDEDVEDLGGHEPSSPLGRMSTFTIGSGGSGGSSRRSNENDSPLLARRRAQYKSTGGGIPGGGTSRRSSYGDTLSRRAVIESSSSPVRPLSSPPIASLFRGGGGGGLPTTPEDPQRAFLRERFKRRCFERATKARENAVKAKRRDCGELGAWNRRRKNANTVGDDAGMEEEDSDLESDTEEIMNDELFRRIMLNVNRKWQHSNRVSFQNEVGSSLDPDMEDVTRWEQELTVPGTATWPSSPAQIQSSTSAATIPPSSSTIGDILSFKTPLTALGPTTPVIDEVEEFDPAEWEDAELDAYAEEYARLMEEEVHQQQQHEQEQQEQHEQREQQSRYEQQQQHFQQTTLPQQYQDTLVGLEDIPEEELFGTWNWENDVDMDV